MTTGGDHEILGLLLVQHQPLHRHVVAGAAPVAQRVEIAHVQAVVESRIHPRQAARDLARHKRFTPPRTLVVEQHPVAGIHAIALAVVHRDPVGIELRYAVGAAGIKGRALPLRDLLHQAVELTGARLVDPRFFGEPQDPQRLQDPHRCWRCTPDSHSRQASAKQ